MESKKVLIAEDSSVIQNLTKKILQIQNYQIYSAKNGVQVLEMLENEYYDVILMDINMPKMDGFTFCSEIRNTDAHKNTPIIIVSTEAEADDKMQGFKAGANLYLVKPVKQEELVENVQMLLQQ